MRFQYITCYSLSDMSVYHMKKNYCFNTSHVTLYREAARRHVIWLMFQYITCYSLSLRILVDKEIVTRFQYITCYSLSVTALQEKQQAQAFQYITCYSLSIPVEKIPYVRTVSIHHMLLFIQF